MKIVTSCICPPIPTRNFDWCAVLDTYEANFIGGENDEWEQGPSGYGPTEQEAISDLMEQLGE